MAKVGIIGAGAWGTAVAKGLGENGHRVQIWTRGTDVAEDINANHRNERYLPDVSLPAALTASTEIVSVVADAGYVIFATPSLHILPTARQILSVQRVAEGGLRIGIITKGFIQTERGTRLIVETLEDYLPGFYKDHLVYISGPSHAEEVARGKLTGLICASASPRNAIRFRELLNSHPLLVFSSLDVVGVQIAAAMKNVIAIAFGIMDALKETAGADFGDNTGSLLLAAGLNEIQTLAIALGATHPETFTSIAGVGDLDVTCRSRYGRNRRFGREIVEKNVLSSFTDIADLIDRISEVGYLPEGVVAARGAQSIIERNSLKLPITEVVYRILNREADPTEAINGILRGLTRGSFGGFLSISADQAAGTND